MNAVFYISAVIAVLATAMAITRLNAVHALLYLVVSLLAAAMIFFTLGAPFIAALEVIIYAGAIMVLFLFLIMLLNIGPEAADQERRWLTPGIWTGPSILAAVLLVELTWVLVQGPPAGLQAVPEPAGAGTVMTPHVVTPNEVGIALYGPYLLGVELASLLLLAGLIGAYHLGRREQSTAESIEQRSKEASAWQPSP